MTYYCFNEKDLYNLVIEINKNSHLHTKKLVLLCIINSSGVKNNIDFHKCGKCDNRVNDEYDHRVFEGNLTYSSEWNCNVREKLNICSKCDNYVNDEFDHRVCEGDRTYSSEWNKLCDTLD